ncbi:SusC/RagA family TonB-linked outer membrane protein [Pedobacter sp. L105]|uniref:SusC/RagA family TonB-linked outer membrane protein n=1 Tax=Pedobacter sp. L105 TaxID=1641871 RepID=UPI00131E177C|nr:SusC/RagA family TonB-linked outer membrane protein [Pedobacter sp. L105]
MKKRLLKNLLWVLMLLVGNAAWSQTRTVTGTVTGQDDGFPLPGVTITAKGTKVGTLSSADGKFSLNVPQGTTSLIFRFIGYTTLEVPINGRTVNAKLNTNNNILNEVVVTGSGVATSKARLGISVETVSAKSLTETPQSTLEQGLIGKIPGAQISSTDGAPGARVNIVLRGINTIQGGTSPMILVDGVESRVTDISLIDPSTVDHMEIVQGAASSTIYGAQGANGVIQIFTKRGKVGGTRIDVSSAVTASSLINNGDVHQARLSSFKTDANGNFINSSGGIIEINSDGIYPGVTWANAAGAYPTAMTNPANIATQQYGTNLKWYDHFKQVFKTAYTRNNNVGISGASDKSDYSITLSDNKQQSIVRTAGYNERTNLTTNLGTELFKNFTLRSSTQLVYNQNTLAPGFGTGNAGALFNVENTSPFYDLNNKLASGDYPNSLNSGAVSVNGSNPFYRTEYGSQKTNRMDLLQSFIADYKPSKFVEFNAKYGLNYSHQEANQLYKDQSQNIASVDNSYYLGGDITGSLYKQAYTQVFQNFNGSATIRTDWQKDFNSKLPITTSTLLQYDYRKDVYKENDIQGVGLQPYAIYNYLQTNSTQVTYDYTRPFITFGYVVNQKIDYGNYGGISGGFRSDYSSAFGGGSKPFTFPNANAYIRPSSFDFWKDLGLENRFPEFKLRGGFGKAGIQPNPFDRYPTLSTQTLGSSLIFTVPTSAANPNLGVEVSREIEAGLDLAIKGATGNWFSSYTLSGTYWTRKGTNIIYQINVPPSTGASSILTNAIDLSSHGIQASLNMNVLKTKNFNWNFTTNFSKQTTTITGINGPPIILASSAGSTQLALLPGQKIGQIYGYKALTSVDELNSKGVRFISAANASQYEIVDGRVVNTATKGIQYSNEVSSFGDPNPKFNMAFINSFNYKHFSFGFQFDWVYGSHLYNQTKEWMYRDGISGDFDKAVTIGGQTAAYTAYYASTYQDIIGARNGGRNFTKDYFYESSSFLRLRNISVGYDFSSMLPNKVFKRVMLTVTGTNILTFTKYTGLDPEANSGNTNSAFDRGVDLGSIPNLKSYQFKLSLGF